MNDPYLMVFINIIISLVAILGIIVYRFIYPKKKIKPLVLLLLIALLPIISIFRTGVYESGDFQTHVMEEISFYHLLGQGEIIPLWGGDMNATYGYPSFHFTYPLPFYLMAVIHFLGFSFINSIKIFLAAAFLLSGIFMYQWLKKEVKEYAAVAGAIFYLFAPYHLIDLHFRADVGEILAFVFLPLCLLTARNFLQFKTKRWFILEVLSFAGLLLSHPALSLAGFAILFIYILIFILHQKKQKLKLLLLQFGTIVSAILLTAFYWLPILFELRYTSSYIYVNSVWFLQFKELLYSPWKYGFLFQGPQGQLSFVLGYIQLVILIFSIILLIKNKIPNTEKSILIVSMLIVIILIFLMLSISKPIWILVPFLKSFQYVYRLHGILLFAISIIAAVLINNIKRTWIIFLICFLAIFLTVLNWGNRRTIPQITDTVLQKEIPYLNVKGSPLAQAITLWSDQNYPWAKKIPTQHLQILKGNGIFMELNRNNTHHVYIVKANTQLTIRENTLFFPGWNVYIDYQPQQIHILTSSNPRGLISFTIPKGLHKIEVVYQDTYAVRVGKIISSISLIVLGILLFLFPNKISLNNIFKNRKR